MEDKATAEVVGAVEAADGGKTNLTKKATKSKAKMQRTKASHPPTSEMVIAAISGLKDRKGSSLQAIKKYITATYKIDGEKIAPFVKRYLKTAVTSGAVLQTKGKGASGSFKLPPTKTSTTQNKKTRVSKKPKSPTKSVEKKASSTKKSSSPSKKASAKESKAAGKKKMSAEPVAAQKSKAAKPKASPQKALSKTRTAKSPAAKPKAPKPKKVTASRSSRSAAKK